MAAVGIRHVLPVPQHTPFVPTFGEPTLALAADAPLYPNKERILELNQYIPPYGSRQGWVPRRPEDYGDGGAFPEIHVAQYPLEMGRKTTTPNNQIVPLTIDSTGAVNYDSIVKQGHRKDVTVFTKPSDLKDKDFAEDELARPDEAMEIEVAERTKKQLEAKLQKKVASKPLAAKASAASKAKYIRYTPANQSPAFNSGANHRIIRMVEMPLDPIEPPKFKHTKVPRGPSSPPVPVMHSPPRKLSKEERDAWRIPPCISNWKNNKGFVIPLDKRLAADGRGLQELTIHDTFAKLSEALYIAERNAREEVARRNAVRHKIELQKQEEREEELRRMAKDARLQRANIQRVAQQEESDTERLARIDRERLREERRREREREHRLEQRASGNKKSKLTRDTRRDIGEKIALGERVPRSQESLYDQRLFNQTQGMDSGFGDDEDYNIYDKRLFGGERERALYKAPKKDDLEQYGEGTSLDAIVNTNRFKPHRDFSGVDRERKTERDGPVQFERDREREGTEAEGDGEEEVDKLGLDEFFQEVREKTRREGEKEKGVKLGVMHAVGGGSGSVDDYRGGRERKINFESSNEQRGTKEKEKPKEEVRSHGSPKQSRGVDTRRDLRGGRDEEKRTRRSPPVERENGRGDRERERDRDRDRERERDHRDYRDREKKRDREDRDDYDRKRSRR